MTLQSQYASCFIWADKAALALAVLAVVIWAMCWWAAYLIVGDQGADYLWLHYGVIGTETGGLGLMSAWLVMRMVDLAAGGVTYGSSLRLAQFLEAALVTGGRAAVKAVRHPSPVRSRQLFNG